MREKFAEKEVDIMPKPDNKYCPKCSEFERPGFYKKYGRLGCPGIYHESGEFPYNAPPHCFTTKKTLTAREIITRKEKKIAEIIRKSKTPLAAAKELMSRGLLA